jgi:hypothetical protein
MSLAAAKVMVAAPRTIPDRGGSRLPGPRQQPVRHHQIRVAAARGAVAHPAKVTFDEDQNPSSIGSHQKTNSAPSHAVRNDADVLFQTRGQLNIERLQTEVEFDLQQILERKRRSSPPCLIDVTVLQFSVMYVR